MRWTEEQLAEYQVRTSQKRAEVHASCVQNQKGMDDTSEPDDTLESKIQGKIERWLKERGFYYWHDRSRKCNAPGHPDLVIALPQGRVLWLELKSKRGRLSPEQIRVRQMLLYLGHEFHIVKSFKQFLEICNATDQRTTDQRTLEITYQK